MRRRNRPHIQQQHSNHVHRWTVSYADYMTLMFALFVVLYAVLLNKKENYQEVLDAIQNVVQVPNSAKKNLQSKGVLIAQSNDIKDENEPALLSDHVNNVNNSNDEHLVEAVQIDSINQLENEALSNTTNYYQGEPLGHLQLSLQSALNNESINSTISFELEGDWLLVQMSGPLLFAAGSHTLLNGAQENIKIMAQILKPVNNYIRLRGYTDTVVISDEIYKSNWELSAMRAISVLRAFEALGINGERMAAEGFGKYQPIVNENGVVDEFKSRRVVIAISKFALFEAAKSDKNITIKEEKVKAKVSQAIKPDSDEIREIYLPDGRLIITTRQE
jgi:chemotaxis protein MotB